MKFPIVGVALLLLWACGQPSEPNPPKVELPTTNPGGSPTQTPPTNAVRDAFLAQCDVTNGVIASGRFVVRPIGQNVSIVALGSSSTEGIGASAKETTYPAIMQSLLNKNTKGLTFSVINKGVAGDTINGMEARLDRDVMSLNPQVVIVQAGLNDANSGMNVDNYYATLTRVVQKLKISSSVILMNSQFYNNEPLNHSSFLSTMNRVATEQNVSVIDRYGIFKSSVQKNIIKIEDILAADKFHNNDFGYECIGKMAADFIVISVE